MATLQPGPMAADRHKSRFASPLALGLTAEAFDALNAAGPTRIGYRDLFCRHADLPRALRSWAGDRGPASPAGATNRLGIDLRPAAKSPFFAKNRRFSVPLA